jgi:hypothetical protein
MEESSVTTSSESNNTPRSAFELLKEEIAAVPEEQLVHINVDIPTAVTSALRALPAVRALRPQLETLVDYDLVQLDKLELYTLAAFHANTMYGMAIRPAESMPELVAEATRVRDLLYSDALALAHREMIDREAIRSVRTAIGYRPLANDLGVLATLLLDNWDAVKSRCAVVEADLVSADSLSHRILNAVAQKEQQPSSAVVKAALTRQRAYTLFFRAYSGARRGVTYLRWNHNDAEAIAPSLFAGRSNGKGKREEEPEQPEPESGVPPALPPAVPPALTPAIPAGIVPALAEGVTPSPIPVGMPGADPFVRS